VGTAVVLGVALLAPAVQAAGAPTAHLALPYQWRAMQPVPMDASASTGEALTYVWSFGDGTFTSGGPFVTHVYSKPDSYTVVVQVTDANHETATVSLSITIIDMWDAPAFQVGTPVADGPTEALPAPAATVGAPLPFEGPVVGPLPLSGGLREISFP
jgi:hypothetical protein